ncbi:hypothetical protein [Bacillus sp. Marseille-P3800]|uniref:hypothetical protein n=1 Tax=Bacillus sp. Marseille-P3800 TaxID=2014782 RepID=UPI000C070B75|nr:hypothetical protein [Bacillus sp. Marseille-P3800]
MARKPLTSEQRQNLVKKLEDMRNVEPSDEKFELTVLKMNDPLIKKMLGRSTNRKTLRERLMSIR